MNCKVNYLLTLSAIIDSLALLTGIISLALPFWIDAEQYEGEVVVNVLRKSHSGLWMKHDTFEIQENSTLKLKLDETLQPLHGTRLDTSELRVVKGLMIIGLLLELLNLIGSIVACCISEKKYLKHLTTIAIGTILPSLLSFILMLIGLNIFESKVKDDYEYDKNELSAGFWLAVVSTVMCFVATVLSLMTYFCFRRKKRTISRSNILHSTAVRY